MPNSGIGTNVITQIAIVVRDIEKTSRTYADVFGVPVPNWILTDAEDTAHTRYMGGPTPARAKLAFFPMGQVTLELIEPVGEPSVWQDWLDEHGEGVHHIAFQIKGMSDVLGYLESKGINEIQTGDFTGGRYAYVDAIKPLRLLIELLEDTSTKE